MVIIVTGIPRSGTSMTMRILDFGGVPVVYDEYMHHIDANMNPHGFYELMNPGSDLTIYDGKALKMMGNSFPQDTPVGDYRVIIPIRTKGADFVYIDDQLDFLRASLVRADIQTLEIPYDDYFDNTSAVMDSIAAFILPLSFDKTAAATAVDPTLRGVI